MESIQIPEALFKEILKRVPESSFKSVDDLITFILQAYLDNQENNTTEDEQEIVEERLRNLGYL